MTLPSNVGHDFLENTVANYTTKLASSIELKGQWEVGLVEMSYTLSWYNVPENLYFSVNYYDAHRLESDELYLPKGRYDKITDIISKLNNVLTKPIRDNIKPVPVRNPKLELDERTRKVTIKNGIGKDNRMIFLQLPFELCQILGFDKKAMDKYNGNMLIKYSQEVSNLPANQRANYVHPMHTDTEQTYIAERPFELSGGTHGLFVYCDIVKPSFVGDSYTQLLRLVQVPSGIKFGDQVLITYANTYYVPLLTHEFETIEVHIKDDVGDTIPFEFGRSIMVLHFRKKKEN